MHPEHSDPLTHALHTLVAHPWVYNQVQLFFGVQALHARLAPHLAALPPTARILDLGGGTGMLQSVVRPDCRYICADLDSQKLHGFRQRSPAGMGVQGNGTQVPFATGSVDALTASAVLHHLPDGLLEMFLSESARVLRSGGRFILLEPIWAPERLPGRLLWRFDRGSYPRSPDHLRTLLQEHFTIVHWELYQIWHRYVIAVGQAV